MTAERDRRAAAAFAGQITRVLRDAGFTVSPASSRHREGLRTSSIARSRCRIVADLDNTREARDLIDRVVTVLHHDHWRTWRADDASVTVWRTGTSIDSHDTRIGEQRYTASAAQERMADGRCPECGKTAEEHSGAREFWLRPSGCDLLPEGVRDRIAQYQTDQAG